jgi:hypothetical protein
MQLLGVITTVLLYNAGVEIETARVVASSTRLD